MNTTKNIESIFQDKFKDFEVAPPEMAWTNIKNELEKKKQKRRIIPLWFKFSGVAAILSIGFFVGTTFNSNLNKNSINLDKNPTKNKFTDIKNTSVKNVLEKVKFVDKSILNQQILSNSNSDKRINLINSVSKTSEKAIVSIKNKSFQKNNIVNKYVSKTSNVISNTKNESELINPKSEIFVDLSSSKADNIVSEKSLEKEQKTYQNFNSSVHKTSEIKIDSLPIAWLSENKLVEISKERESIKIAKKETKISKWQISTNVSSIYANSTSKGSSIDQKYVDNEKTYENNISFGVGVNYALSPKIKIRTGINKFSLGYNTNNVGFYTTNSPLQTLDNVTQNSLVSGQNISFVDNNTTVIPARDDVGISFDPEITSVEKGTINQKLGYYEVPVEVSYALIDKRFGINLIGGISTLFLNENKIATLTQTSKIETGKADNLNNIHFSTNIGVGFKYNLIKSIQINIDPMLKYQINTFSNDVGGFKPYFFGIYTGINYQF